MIVSYIKEVMDTQGLTVRQLSEQAGIAYNTAHALYKGHTGRIDLDILDRVCKILNVQPGDLFVRIDDGQVER